MTKFHILTIDDKGFILSLTIIVKPYEICQSKARQSSRI